MKSGKGCDGCRSNKCLEKVNIAGRDWQLSQKKIIKNDRKDRTHQI